MIREPAGPLDRGVAVLGCVGDTAAIEVGDRTITTAEVEHRASCVARSLEEAGVEAGDRVLMPTALGLDHVLGLLGILRLGATPVPVGDEHPAASLGRIRLLAEPTAEIAPDGTVTPCRSGAGGARRRHPEEGYVLFTSGSTGAPKGVVGSRAGLAARLAWGRQAFHSGDVQRCAIRVAPVFIDSLTEVLGTLQAGRTLVLAPPGVLSDIDALGRFLEDREIEQVTLTPSMLPVLARGRIGRLQGMRRWILSGESLPGRWAELARALAPRAEIINAYGSTEVAGDVAFHCIRPEEAIPTEVPIGRVVPGVRWKLRPTDQGEEELLVAGVQLALGFLGDGPARGPKGPGHTSTLSSDEWLPTGDLVRREGAALVVVGRIGDLDQVRGVRVDLRGVASALEALEEVVEAFAEVRADQDGGRLVAHVVRRADDSVTGASLLAAMAARCPPQLVPDELRIVRSLPRTPTGKIDRRKLSVEPLPPAERGRFATDLEFAVASLAVSHGLAVEPDRTTPLAALGVDSVRAVLLASVLSEMFGVEIVAAMVLGDATVTSVANAILRQPDSGSASSVRMAQGGNPGGLTLAFLPPAIGTGLAYFRLLPSLVDRPAVVILEQTGAGVAAVRAGGCAGLGRWFAKELLEATPGSQLVLAGWSFGALTAVHAQHELARSGLSVAATVLLDPARDRELTMQPTEAWARRRILTDCGYEAALPGDAVTAAAAQAIIDGVPGSLEQLAPSTFVHWVETMSLNAAATMDPFPAAPTVRTLIVRASATSKRMEYPGWVRSGPEMEVVDAPVSHFDLLSPEFAGSLGEIVTEFLRP